MRLLSPRKVVVALASVLALFVISANPAAAAGPFNIDITGGFLTAAGNTFDLTPGSQGTPPCSPKASTLVLNTDTPAAGQWTVTGTFTTFFRLGTPPSGPWYQADITINAKGTYSGSSPYTLATAASQHLTFQARVYQVDTGGSCAKDVLKCIIAGRAVSSAGSYTGTLPASAVGDTGSLTASTGNAGGLNMVTSSCAAPFVAWNGQVASLHPLNFIRVV